MQTYLEYKFVNNTDYHLCAIDLGIQNTSIRIEHRTPGWKAEIFQCLINFNEDESEGTEKVKVEGKNLIEKLHFVFKQIYKYLDVCSYIFIEKQLNANTKAIQQEGMIIGILTSRYLTSGPNICPISATAKSSLIKGCELEPWMKEKLKGRLPKPGVKREAVAYALRQGDEWISSRKLDDISDTIVYCDVGAKFIRHRYDGLKKTDLVQLCKRWDLDSIGTSAVLAKRLAKSGA